MVAGIQYPRKVMKEDLVEITAVLSNSWMVKYKPGERHFDLPKPLPAEPTVPDAPPVEEAEPDSAEDPAEAEPTAGDEPKPAVE